MHIKLILTLILIGLVVLFVVQNTAVVDIRFLFWTAAMSRALLIFFVLAVGIIIGWLWRGYTLYKEKTLR